jgi:hypothetical protein
MIKKILLPCIIISQFILKPFMAISNQLNIINISLKLGNSSSTICQTNTNVFYGKTTTKNKTTNILINSVLFETPNTLHNVLYHEILHSFGLRHSNNAGLMNYSIQVDEFGAVIDDSNKLYPSYDDLFYMRRVIN